MSSPARYQPNRPFPGYAYLPGESPHPTRDPAGHSYQAGEEDTVRPCPPGDWATCSPYLFGVDLYNAGFLWEAHEAWESLWHVSKGDRSQAQFIQGLIQCTAAALKVRMGQPKGVERLGEQGTQRLESTALQVSNSYMGLDVLEFVHDFREFVASSPTDPEDRPRIHLPA